MTPNVKTTEGSADAVAEHVLKEAEAILHADAGAAAQAANTTGHTGNTSMPAVEGEGTGDDKASAEHGSHATSEDNSSAAPAADSAASTAAAADVDAAAADPAPAPPQIHSNTAEAHEEQDTAESVEGRRMAEQSSVERHQAAGEMSGEAAGHEAQAAEAEDPEEAEARAAYLGEDSNASNDSIGKKETPLFAFDVVMVAWFMGCAGIMLIPWAILVCCGMLAEETNDMFRNLSSVMRRGNTQATNSQAINSQAASSQAISSQIINSQVARSPAFDGQAVADVRDSRVPGDPRLQAADGHGMDGQGGRESRATLEEVAREDARSSARFASVHTSHSLQAATAAEQSAAGEHAAGAGAAPPKSDTQGNLF